MIEFTERARTMTDGPPAPVSQLPLFLDRAAEPAQAEQSIFIGRERELRQLDELLQKALAGRVQVVFVIGEAGQGKTSLLHEFARRAQALDWSMHHHVFHFRPPPDAPAHADWFSRYATNLAPADPEIRLIRESIAPRISACPSGPSVIRWPR